MIITSDFHSEKGYFRGSIKKLKILRSNSLKIKRIFLVVENHIAHLLISAKCLILAMQEKWRIFSLLRI